MAKFIENYLGYVGKCWREWLAQLVEHAPINLLAFASVVSSLLGGCHFASLGKTLNLKYLQWAEEFHQCIFTDICGLLPELLFSVDLPRALPQPSGKWITDNNIELGKDEAP